MIELHGDGQYDFAAVPLALNCLKEGCDLVLGNRFHSMLQPLRDGMDLARYLGNIFLTTVGRLGLGIPTRDLFPGFRAYSRKFVETIDVAGMSKNYFFSFEIIAQARYMGLKICQIPVRCDYKGEHTSMKMSKAIPAIQRHSRSFPRVEFSEKIAVRAVSGTGPGMAMLGNEVTKVCFVPVAALTVDHVWSPL